MVMVSIPLSHIEIHSERLEFIAAKHTIEMARMRNDSQTARELIGITTHVAEMNQWLVSTQHLNGTIFDIWIPDEVDSIELME